MNFLKTFEGFNKDYLKSLVDRDFTYLRKFDRLPPINLSTEPENYNKLIVEIRLCDFSFFEVIDKGYLISVIPDDHFKYLISLLNQCSDEKIKENIQFNFMMDKNDNRIHFDQGLPRILQGLSIAYKIYKLLLKKYKYLTTAIDVTEDAYNLWYSLMTDESLYCFTSKKISGILSKKLNNIEIKEIFDNLRNIYTDLIFEFDEPLKEKIIEIYGSLDIHS